MADEVEIAGSTATVDAAVVAGAFGITPDEVRDLMRGGAITTRHERGEGTDEGRARLSFFYGGRALRLTIDERSGVILSRARFNVAPRS